MEEVKQQEEKTKDMQSNALESKSRRLSLVWVVPLIALIVFLILLWNNSLDKGSKITIRLPSAESIEEGKTLVKLHSVTVGQVTEVNLDDDYDSAVLTVQMAKDTDDLLREDSLFWVVKPRFETTSISGLDTLISGSYIEMRRGKSDNISHNFSMLSDPPTDINNTKGIEIILYSTDSKRLNPGDIITYHGFTVGNIVSSSLDLEKRRIKYVIFISDPYTSLVNSETRFWISSGLDVSIGTDGVNFNTDSLNNILRGGISFDNFFDSDAKELQPLCEMTLFKNQNEARIDASSSGIRYVVMVNGGLKKIREGADVIFEGLKVGEVLVAPWIQDLDSVFLNYKEIPVLIAINVSDKQNQDLVQKALDDKLQEGSLQATAGAASLITGFNQIELFYSDKKEPTSEVKSYRNVKVIPYINLPSLQDNISTFVNHLEQLDVKGISDNVKTALASVSDAMKAFKDSNDALEKTKLINKLTEAFTNFNNVVKSYNKDSDLYKKLDSTLKDLDKLVNEITPAISKISDQPSSIIFGVKDSDPVPPKKK